MDLRNDRVVVTLVTGLWDIGRSGLTGSWSRKYHDYLDRFEELLKVDYNMVIFGDKELEQFVMSRRSVHNTQFVLRDLEWFRKNDYYGLIQKIRLDPKWYEQVGWLRESTQAKLEMYNPIVMSKMFLLHDAVLLDKFGSDFMYWIDAGLTFTVNMGYFIHDDVLAKLVRRVMRFVFVAFPYDASLEIHGFDFGRLCEYAGTKVDLVARGGFFGGSIDLIREVNGVYYDLLMETLGDSLMGTEESLFTIIMYKFPELVDYANIKADGMMWTFFEDLKENRIVIHNDPSRRKLCFNGTMTIGVPVS